MNTENGLEVLEVAMRFGANESLIHPLLFWDEREGATLVDTGVPGSHVAIGGHLERLGLGWKDIRRIILTHQDIDHIGGASAIVEASGAEVLAHPDDIPYIQGEKRILKMDPKRVEAMVQSLPDGERERVRAFLTTLPKVRVTRPLADGERLPYRGGVTVIHTPGHTPGHVSLFLSRDRLLVAGDALRVEKGRLEGPSPQATPDLPQAIASLRKLLDLPIERVLCYHGGLASTGVRERLTELAASS